MTASRLTAALFSTQGIERIFSGDATVQRMLEVEAALARALAQEGIIPATSVPPIVEACNARLIDTQALTAAAGLAGNLAIPLIRQLTARVAASDPEAARHVHWGVTSQDIIDTALVLQLREALALLRVELSLLADVLAGLVHRHRQTPMMGRTWMQQALPTTLGLKAAGWLDAVLRHEMRLAQMTERLCVLQFGGATGTLASLGDRGLSVSAALARELSLALPALPWHTQRDRVAECATTLGLLTGTLGKIARDIALSAQTEIGELAEPEASGRGGSSTMPHKRNPVACAAVLAAAMRVPPLVSTMLSAMVQEQERALGAWQAEWETLPEIVALTAASLTQLHGVLAGLQVDTARMRANLEHTRGLVMAEAVSLALAAHLGREAAHDLVEHACAQALAQRSTLQQVLAAEPRVSALLSPEQLAACFDPARYLGQAEAFADRVLTVHRERKG